MKEKTLNILDPEFKYTQSSKTDISKTFARIRKELKLSANNQESNEPLVSRNSWGIPEIPPLKRHG